MNQERPGTAPTDSKVHELKTWPQDFQAIKSGLKKFELRKNDKGFKPNDILVLKEFKPTAFHPEKQKWIGKYTGEEVRVKVLLVMEGEYFNEFGLMPGYCIMSIDFEYTP